MREICASGSVGGEGGNVLAYPARGEPPSSPMEYHGRIWPIPSVTGIRSLAQLYQFAVDKHVFRGVSAQKSESDQRSVPANPL